MEPDYAAQYFMRNHNEEHLRLWQEVNQPHFLIDDYHEVSWASRAMIRLLAGREVRITAAVNPSLRIGGRHFAAYEPAKEFLHLYGNAYRTIKLEGNYRCSPITQRLFQRVMGNLEVEEQAREVAAPGTPELPVIRARAATPEEEALTAERTPINLYRSAEQMDNALATRLGEMWRDGKSLEGTMILSRRMSTIRRIIPRLREQSIPLAVLADAPVLPSMALHLSTFHQSIGHEWNQAILVDFQDALIPGPLAESDPSYMDDELRLLGIAVSRARQCTFLAFSHSSDLSQVSRFSRLLGGLAYFVDWR